MPGRWLSSTVTVANCIPEGDNLILLRGREREKGKEGKRQNNKERPPLGNHPTAEKRTQHYHHPAHVLRASIVIVTYSGALRTILF